MKKKRLGKARGLKYLKLCFFGCWLLSRSVRLHWLLMSHSLRPLYKLEVDWPKMGSWFRKFKLTRNWSHPKFSLLQFLFKPIFERVVCGDQNPVSLLCSLTHRAAAVAVSPSGVVKVNKFSFAVNFGGAPRLDVRPSLNATGLHHALIREGEDAL